MGASSWFRGGRQRVPFVSGKWIGLRFQIGRRPVNHARSLRPARSPSAKQFRALRWQSTHYDPSSPFHLPGFRLLGCDYRGGVVVSKTAMCSCLAQEQRFDNLKLLTISSGLWAIPQVRFSRRGRVPHPCGVLVFCRRCGRPRTSFNDRQRASNCLVPLAGSQVLVNRAVACVPRPWPGLRLLRR